MLLQRVRRFIAFGWLLALLPLVAFSSQGVWQQAGDAPVSGGSGEAIVATDQAVYVVSQMRVNTPSRFWSFTPGSPDSAQKLSVDDLPEGAFRNGTALAWDHDSSGYLYALLGARSPQEGDVNRRLFYRYNLDRDSWEPLVDTPAPQGAGDALVYVKYDGKERFYSFLGSNAHDSTQTMSRSIFAVYDIQAESWDTLELNPSWHDEGTDEGASLVWDGFDHIYALQGGVDKTNPLGRFAVYSLATKSWMNLADNPETFNAQGKCGISDGASLAYLGEFSTDQSDYIYALGGGCVDKSPGTHFYRYRISTDEWETLTDVPCPVGFYNGNRLFSLNKELYYWQGSPTTARFICGGDDVFRFELH